MLERVRSSYQTIGTPYLPLWEHTPDGEPRVFEHPDNLGGIASVSSGLTTPGKKDIAALIGDSIIPAVGLSVLNSGKLGTRR